MITKSKLWLLLLPVLAAESALAIAYWPHQRTAEAHRKLVKDLQDSSS